MPLHWLQFAVAVAFAVCCTSTVVSTPLPQHCNAVSIKAAPGMICLLPCCHVCCHHGAGAVAWGCCNCSQQYCLVMLLLSLLSSIFLFPIAGTITIAIHCHHHPLLFLSLLTVVITIAINHCHHFCHWPLSLPSPLIVDHLNLYHWQLIVTLFFICCSLLSV